MKRSTPESGVKKFCEDLLAAHNIWHMRINSGSMFASYVSKKTGKTKGRKINLAKAGTADILSGPILCSHLGDCEPGENRCCAGAAKFPFFLWLETKAGKDGEQSPEQIEFQAEVEASGHIYLLIRQPEDLLLWLRQHSVIP